jgi:GTPase SAR1 family protein
LPDIVVNHNEKEEPEYKYFKVSAKTGENIEKLFKHIAEELVSKSAQVLQTTHHNTTFSIYETLTNVSYCDSYKPRKRKIRWCKWLFRH